MREIFGSEKFDEALDAYGRANAGKKVSEAHFFVKLIAATDKKDTLLKHISIPKPPKPIYTILSFLEDPQECAIVYGTRDEEDANREAAIALQRLYPSQGDERNGAHLPRYGCRRCRSQREARHPHWQAIYECGCPTVRKAFPIEFAEGTFTVNGDLFANPDSGIVVAG